MVFLILSRKAPAIKHPAQLPAWLFQTTRYAAANARKIAARRAFHERQAARPEVPYMSYESTSLPPANLHSELEDALAILPQSERHVILLRYFRGQEYAVIATSLGITEVTARKRLWSAPQKWCHLI